jgi:predicted ribosome quality control (RQC) complex YloA/Tae2 family protein
MSLSGAYIHTVKAELIAEGLIGARVEKIHQPSREEIVLSLHTRGGSVKLLLSANPASARICLTSRSQENPPAPPMFCQLLRKRLASARLVEIAQDGFERIVFFKFHCRNEIGDEETIILSVEIMGRSSNIVLLIERDGELRVIDALKRVTDDVSSVRRVLPGLVYELPPREKRLSLLNFTKAELMNALENREHERLEKALIRIFEGVCPLFAREAAFRADESTAPGVEYTDSLYLYLENAQYNFKPTMLIDSEKKPYDFTFVDVKQYGDLMTVVPFESANALLDSFYAGQANSNRLKQSSGAVLKTLKSSYERVLRKLDLRRAELAACGEREKYRRWGDLISANLYALEKGADSLTARDFETDEEVKVPLDPRLAPAKNAQKYYAEYKKLQGAEKTLTKLIRDSEQELIYLESVQEAASRALGDSDLLEIKRELIESGYHRAGGTQSPKKSAKQEKPGEPLKFISSDNVNILVGKNNRQNDLLTFKTAKPREIWLHTKDIAGSHVIIKSENPSEQTLEEAAQLAAWFSKAQDSSRVPVDYTEVRYVKKPHGAKPGMVIFTHNKTLYVTPSEEVINKLKGNTT